MWILIQRAPVGEKEQGKRKLKMAAESECRGETLDIHVCTRYSARVLMD